jgi:tetratricopeptide (TPR) repeat protein
MQEMGDMAAARSGFERALEIETTAYGPSHPRLAETLNSLAALLALQGSIEEARAGYQRSLDILTASLPPRHPRVLAVRKHLSDLAA